MAIVNIIPSASVTTYQANPGDTVVCKGTYTAFTVTLPSVTFGAQYGPATQSTVVGTTGAQAPPIPVSQGLEVAVVNEMSGSSAKVTVVTADGSLISNLTGSTGVYVLQYNNAAWCNDGVNPASSSNWAQVGGQGALVA